VRLDHAARPAASPELFGGEVVVHSPRIDHSWGRATTSSVRCCPTGRHRLVSCCPILSEAHSVNSGRWPNRKRDTPGPLGGDRRHPSIPLGETLRAKNNDSSIKLADLCGVFRSRSRPTMGNIWDIVRCRSVTSRRPCAPCAAASGSLECACREARWRTARPSERRMLPFGSEPHDDQRAQARDPQ
jgi:hypothetical protein